MKIVDYKKLIIYLITLVFMVIGIVRLCDTPNDSFLKEGYYLLMIFISLIIQILYLCSKQEETELK